MDQNQPENEPTLERAASDTTKAARYDIIEAALLDGDVFGALEVLNGKNTPQSFARLADNFLPALLRLSKDMYVRATRPAFLTWFEMAYRDGEFMGDEDLRDAARKLAVHMFGTEEQRKAEESYRIFNREVMDEAHARLETIVFDRLNDADPTLTAFTRRAIAADTLAELDRRLGEDSQLASSLQSLWSLAHDGGLLSEHRQAILNAHLSRARQLVPGILSRIVAEALGHQVKASTDVRPMDLDLLRDVAFVNARKH